ncbi:DNA glycosylase [Aspergillus oleicola]
MARSLRSAAAAAREATADLLAGPPTKPRVKQERQRKRARKVEDADDSELLELPHNLGSVPTFSKAKTEDDEANGHIKNEDKGPLATELQHTVNKARTTKTLPPSPTSSASPKKSTKRAKKSNTYGLTPGVTPFPTWPHPTPEECEEVNRLLSSIHGKTTAPATIPEPSLTVTGCGEVPSVLDALIRTLLSGNTTGRNSAAAFNGLVTRFGVLESGIGKGSVDWNAVRRAEVKDVFEAIKSGGLAGNKSRNIKAILDIVYEENRERRDLLVKGDDAVVNADDSKDGKSLEAQKQQLKDKSPGAKQYEIACYDQSFLSLNHLHTLSTQEALSKLMSYPGIGPKTAACVALFCLQRPCFAVDTHIFRIAKWLNWVPPDKATEISAFRHLEVRIPDHLKYSLHSLLIRHGKSCPRCRAITGLASKGWEEGCVIEHLVRRTGKRKGGGDGAGKVKRNRKKSVSESELTSMSASEAESP